MSRITKRPRRFRDVYIFASKIAAHKKGEVSLEELLVLKNSNEAAWAATVADGRKAIPEWVEFFNTLESTLVSMERQ